MRIPKKLLDNEERINWELKIKQRETQETQELVDYINNLLPKDFHFKITHNNFITYKDYVNVIPNNVLQRLTPDNIQTHLDNYIKDLKEAYESNSIIK